MLPAQLVATDSESERAKYKIVRSDTLADVEGMITSADVKTGVCLVKLKNGASQEHNFGPGGLRIVGR